MHVLLIKDGCSTWRYSPNAMTCGLCISAPRRTRIMCSIPRGRVPRPPHKKKKKRKPKIDGCVILLCPLKLLENFLVAPNIPLENVNELLAFYVILSHHHRILEYGHKFAADGNKNQIAASLGLI